MEVTQLVGACPLVGRYTIAGWYPGGACPFVGNPAGAGYFAVTGTTDSDSGEYPAAGERATTPRRGRYLEATAPPTPAAAATPAARGSPPIMSGRPAAIGSPPVAPTLTPCNADASGMPPSIAA